jgi:16S rRNA (cytidine1402-2'-O)-methyltransferase
MQQGILYLIPVPISEQALHTLSPEIGTVTAGLRYYFVENIRTARRFLRQLHPTLEIDNLHFSEIDKNRGADTALLRQWLREGKQVGVMSEAGCPGIADPGAALAATAHDVGAAVVPLTGPSSVFLALMASGLNGQCFRFDGYLPVKEPALSQRIKTLESRSEKDNETQIFIETPYRNNQIMAGLLRHLRNNTRLCVAQQITGPDAFIRTQKISDWKKQPPTLAKAPAVFLLLAEKG